METVTLKAEDFRTVHNTLCELRGLVERMTHSMIKIDDVERIVASFEQGLADAYDQDNAQFESKMDYYSSFQRENQLRSVWSVYELPRHGFLEQPPFPGAQQLAYRDHWGEPQFVEIKGETWADLYRAADRAIQGSGDSHHVFIEQFTVNPSEPRQLLLSTGS